ncbi:hypothetical protein HPB49_000317 [Dermacentor silvarum]|uniref:Uncharacterized protein n=1 Tax=Dermacentor silvarum TaxID=543639 RepID=A0ACB8CCH1_DERSI|nr:hypothetical protein HPB49_000317 [Dermacentor silvarum]
MMMKMRSPKLYEHLRRETIMVLPGRTCLQSYLQRFKGGFGLSANIFNALTEKSKTMDAYSRHGGLVIDEIKLSEHLNVKSAGHIEGFVDLGDHTPADQKNVLADHGMVVLFQPFTGNWTQILVIFASKGNVKSATLAKIVVETTVLAEKAGLFVDCITCDGASWNRSMWRLFGIQGCNDHPTVSQFLVTVNLLAFYNLAKPPRGGNCPPDIVKALLNPTELCATTGRRLLDRIDGLLDRGSINEAEDAIQSLVGSGYVARKIIAKNACPQCAGCLCHRSTGGPTLEAQLS